MTKKLMNLKKNKKNIINIPASKSLLIRAIAFYSMPDFDFNKIDNKTNNEKNRNNNYRKNDDNKKLKISIYDYSILENINLCDDVISTIKVFKKLGTDIKVNKMKNYIKINKRKINKRNFLSKSFSLPEKLNCGESGLLCRMLISIIPYYLLFDFTIKLFHLFENTKTTILKKYILKDKKNKDNDNFLKKNIKLDKVNEGKFNSDFKKRFISSYLNGFILNYSKKSVLMYGKGSLNKRVLDIDQNYLNQGILKFFNFEFIEKYDYLPVKISYNIEKLKELIDYLYDLDSNGILKNSFENKEDYKNDKENFLKKNDFLKKYFTFFENNCNEIVINSFKTSQIATGAILVSSKLPFETTINLLNIRSKPYIDLTLDFLRKINVSFDVYDNDVNNIVHNNSIKDKVIYKNNYNLIFYKNDKPIKNSIYIEGDWSAAAFFYVYKYYMLKNSYIFKNDYRLRDFDIKGVDVNSKQGDRVIYDFFNSKIKDEKFKISKDNKFKINFVNGYMESFNFDAKDNPDLVPPLVLLASGLKGISTIYSVKRLKNKESNRINSLIEGFSKLKVKLHYDDDNDLLKVYGVDILNQRFFNKNSNKFNFDNKNNNLDDIKKKIVINSFNDHRIVMTFAFASLIFNKKIKILNEKSVKKSFPDFFKEFNKLKNKN